jgi:hypothetical protein
VLLWRVTGVSSVPSGVLQYLRRYLDCEERRDRGLVHWNLATRYELIGIDIDVETFVGWIFDAHGTQYNAINTMTDYPIFNDSDHHDAFLVFIDSDPRADSMDQPLSGKCYHH